MSIVLPWFGVVMNNLATTTPPSTTSDDFVSLVTQWNTYLVEEYRRQTRIAETLQQRFNRLTIFISIATVLISFLSLIQPFILLLTEIQLLEIFFSILTATVGAVISLCTVLKRLLNYDTRIHIADALGQDILQLMNEILFQISNHTLDEASTRDLRNRYEELLSRVSKRFIIEPFCDVNKTSSSSIVSLSSSSAFSTSSSSSSIRNSTDDGESSLEIYVTS